MTTKYHYVKPHRVQFVHVLLRWITSGYRPNYSPLIRYYLHINLMSHSGRRRRIAPESPVDQWLSSVPELVSTRKIVFPCHLSRSPVCSATCDPISVVKLSTFQLLELFTEFSDTAIRFTSYVFPCSVVNAISCTFRCLISCCAMLIIKDL
jgi:hypothetical protein